MAIVRIVHWVHLSIILTTGECNLGSLSVGKYSSIVSREGAEYQVKMLS